MTSDWPSPIDQYRDYLDVKNGRMEMRMTKTDDSIKLQAKNGWILILPRVGIDNDARVMRHGFGSWSLTKREASKRFRLLSKRVEQ